MKVVTSLCTADGQEFFLPAAAGAALPVGTVLYTAAVTPPAGFLICNGAPVGRETYPDLFNAIGTTYGAGDGSTTFNLPNLLGASNTVQPAALTLLPCIKAFDSYTNSGIIEVSTLVGNVSQLDTRITETLGTVDGLSGTVNGLSGTVDGLSGTVDGLSGTVNGLSGTVNGLSGTVNTLSGTVTSLSNTVSNLPASSPAYLVNSWRSGANWWRRYSDGWVEQGGFYSSRRPGTYTITFHTAFANADIIFLAMPYTDGGEYAPTVAYDTNPPNGTKVNISLLNTNMCRWFACGQGA